MKAGMLTPAQADILDSLASPMTALGLAEDTGRDLAEVAAGLLELHRLGRIQPGTREGEWRRGAKSGSHGGRAHRLVHVRALLRAQGRTTVGEVAALFGVGREAARAYLEDVGAVVREGVAMLDGWMLDGGGDGMVVPEEEEARQWAEGVCGVGGEFG